MFLPLSFKKYFLTSPAYRSLAAATHYYTLYAKTNLPPPPPTHIFGGACLLNGGIALPPPLPPIEVQWRSRMKRKRRSFFSCPKSLEGTTGTSLHTSKQKHPYTTTGFTFLSTHTKRPSVSPHIFSAFSCILRPPLVTKSMTNSFSFQGWGQKTREKLEDDIAARLQGLQHKERPYFSAPMH